jgi:outer membrane receptor protein involved in Fe transport
MAILKRLLFLLLPICAFAQPDTSRINIELDVLDAKDLNHNPKLQQTTITSASRQAQDIKDVPYTAYVITNEQIRQRGYSSLVDVMKDLPGIKVSQPGSALHGETFLMRGLFGNYYVKILVDDLPIQPSATSGMPLGYQLPILQAERIEVLYGPAAAIYGADAMAGVINIVTKKADKLYFFDADLQARVPGNFKFDATIAGKFARKNKVWNYMIYGGLYQFDNLPITGNEYEEVYNPANYVLTGDEDIYLNSDYYKGTKTQPAFSQLPDESQKFGIRFGNKKLSVGFDYGRRATHSAIGSNPIYNTYHDPNNTFGEQIVRTFFSYKTNLGQWYSQSNLQYLFYEVNPNSTYTTVNNINNFEGRFYNYAKSGDVYIEQFLSRDLGSRWSILTGATFQVTGNLPQFDLYSEPFDPSSYQLFSNQAPAGYEFLTLFESGPYNFYNVGGLIELDYKTEKLTALLGVRADYREFFGLALNPRIGLVYRLSPKNTIRFSSSTAYRPPSSYFIHSGITNLNLNDSLRIGLPSANNNLLAERLFNVDVGWLVHLSEKHALDFSAFFHRNSNLITRTNIPIGSAADSTEYYGFVNDENSSARLLGIQVADIWRFNVGRVGVTSNLSMQWVSGRETLPFNRGILNHYRMQPSFTGKWLVEVQPFANFYASVRFHYVSEWRTRSVFIPELEDELVADAFYLIDLNFRYTFSPGKDVYIMVNNLTNNAYYGIGATGGVGVLNNGNIIFEDLVFNPQLLRLIKVGIRFTL